jgi:hypothetical protein
VIQYVYRYEIKRRKMALKPKTFRTSDDVILALKQRVETIGDISESDIINNALRCYLGLSKKTECETYISEVDKLRSDLEKIISINNLKAIE